MVTMWSPTLRHPSKPVLGASLAFRILGEVIKLREAQSWTRSHTADMGGKRPSQLLLASALSASLPPPR